MSGMRVKLHIVVNSTGHTGLPDYEKKGVDKSFIYRHGEHETRVKLDRNGDIFLFYDLYPN